MTSPEIIDKLIKLIQESGKSYDQIAEDTLISRSTLSRLVKNRTASTFTISQLVSYFEIGAEYREMTGGDVPSGTCQLAAELLAEMGDVRSYYERKTGELRAHYEERISYLREQNATLTEERTREREAQQRTYDRTTAHLKEEIAALNRNKDEIMERLLAAKERANDEKTRADVLDAKRHHVFLGMLVVIILLLIALIIALSTDRIF